MPALTVLLGLALAAAAAPLQAQAVADEPASVTELPLAARTARPVGATLFERLPPERTGVHFQHRWRPEARYLHVLGNAMAGGGVAAGDVDGDGLPELLFTRPSGGSQLYRNLGGMRFADMSQAAGILPERWGGGATFGDLDGDGHTDLYVCGYDTPNRLYWNDGDASFSEGAEAAGVGFLGASVMLALADADLDGDLDGYLLTNRFATQDVPDRDVPYENGRIVVPDDLVEQFDVLTRPDGSTVLVSAGQFDHLYRNNGDRSFTDVSAAAGISGNHYGLSATWFDRNVDGLPDLYVANDFFGPDKLYDNRGALTFVDIAETALPHTPWFSMGADAADVNGDLLPDLFASDMSGTSHARRQVTMTDLSEGRWFLEAAVPRQYMRNALLLNTGTDRFTEAALLAGVARSDWTWSTVFGDLDNDGRQDLYISNGMTRDYFNYDLRMAAARTGSIMTDFWVQQAPLAEANLTFRNQGGLAFESVGPAWGLEHVAVSFGATLVDLDRDGDLDVVCNDFEAPAAVFENRSSEGHVLELQLSGRGGNTAAVGARVVLASVGPHGSERQQLRELFPSRGYMSGADSRLHFGLGDHTKVLWVEIFWPGGGVQRVTGLAVDCAYRIRQTVGAEDTPDAVPAGAQRPTPLYRTVQGPRAAELPYDEFSRQPLLPARLSQLGPPLAVGDVDGDGDHDLYLGGPGGQAGIIMQVGGGSLAATTPVAVGLDDSLEDMGALFLDADSDGDLDLLVTSGSVECKPGSLVLLDRLYLNQNDGTFTRAPADDLPDQRQSSSALCAADLDGDGDLDLFCGSRSVPGQWPEGGQSQLLRNTGGRFELATDSWAPGLSEHGRVTGALFLDVDDDGDADLMVAHEWGPLRLWRNTDGLLVDDTVAAGLSELTGFWNGLAAADIDGDGDLDLAAGNLGLNTRTRAEPGAPAVLFHGDLDGSGTHTIAEAVWVDGRLAPVRTRNDVLAAIPFLAEFFPSYESWANASLEDVFGADALAAAERLSASTCATGVFLNDGSGHFSFRPLPVQAQIAPVFGLAFTEVDGDGVPDLALAMNSFAPQAEHGRLDGGLSLVLLGDGQGGFHPLRADHSGVVVAGDSKALSILDLDGDGWPDLAISQNDGPLQLLLRRGPKTGRVLAVTPVGAAGNPAAVGARIGFTRADLPDQLAEISAGGSYLSQHAPVAWFGLGPARDDEPVGSLAVRWPDGSRSQHQVAPGITALSVRQP